MRNRRNLLASEEDPTPATHADNGTPAEGEIDEEENGEAAAVATAGTLAAAAAGERHRYCSRSHPNALLMDFDTGTLLSRRTARR
jgi:hypothetical protein